MQVVEPAAEDPTGGIMNTPQASKKGTMDQRNYWKNRITRRQALGAGAGLAFGGAAITLVGCSSSSTKSTGNTPAARGSAGATTATSSSSPAAKKGGTLKFGESGPLLNANPPYSINSVNNLTPAIWDNLFRYKDLNLSPAPRLAQAYEFNGDQSEITIQLRANLTFQDGKPLDAQAVVDSFTSLSAPSTPTSQVAGVAAAYVDSVAAVDSTHVKFALKRPGNLIFDMFNFWNIADASNIESVAKGGLPNGSGPFQVASSTPGQGAKLTAFKNFWKAPLLDGIDFTIYPSESSLVLAEQSGGIDVAYGIVANDAQALGKAGFDIITTNGYVSFYTIRFNVKGQAVSDNRVRQALYHAIDRSRDTQGVFLGYAQPAVSIWPPFSAAFDDRYKADPLDVAEAKKLLSAAGFADGTPDIEVLISSDDTISKGLFEFYQADASKAGINLKLNVKPRAAATKEFISGGYPGANAGLVGFTWMRPDTAFVMAVQLRIPNSSNFDTPAYEAFQKQIAAANTDSARKAAYQVFNGIWDDQLWMFPICNAPAEYAASKNTNMVVDTFGTPDFESVSLG